MPDPAVVNTDPDSQEAQMKLLETLVGDLPAFAPGVDTGQGIDAPDGEAARAFYQSFNPQPPQPAVPAPNNGPTAVSAPSQAAAPLAPQPAPAPAAPQPSPSGQLLAGMYRSVPELENGYKKSREEAKRLYDENIALRAAQLATERIGGFRQPREEPTPPAHIPVQFQGDQPVVPVNDFRTEVLNAARAAAQEAVSGILTPMQQLGSANANLRTSYPEFSQQEVQFSNWLRDNPRYQDLIQQSPDVGLESAYLKFARDTGTQQVTQATQNTLAAQNQVDAARQQAAPAGNVAPASRRPTEAESKWTNLQRIYQECQQTGNFKPFVKARTEFALGEQFINTLDRTNWGR